MVENVEVQSVKSSSTTIGNGVHHNLLKVPHFVVQILELSFRSGQLSKTHVNSVRVCQQI